MATEDFRACAICGRMLSHHTTLAGKSIGWEHGAQEQPEDHPAVPVSLDQIELLGRCDFCNVDFPAWEVPARDFELPLPGQRSCGAWSACDTCADLLRRDRWAELLDRCARLGAERNGMSVQVVRALVGPLFRRLRKNITGPVRRVSR